MAEQIRWDYRYEDCSSEGAYEAWMEFFETIYDGKPIVLDVVIKGHVVFKGEDGWRLKFYKDGSKTDFIGLQGRVKDGEPFFIKGSDHPERKGQTQMSAGERPNLEDFVEKYRPIFESQRLLQKELKDYFYL